MRLLARAGSIAAVLALVVVVAGCKDKAAAKADPKVLEAQNQAEQDLLARRDALLQSREQLDAKKTELQAKIDEARKAGTDTTDLETELAKLSSEANANQDELVELLKRQNESYKAQLETMRAAGGGGGGGDASAEISALTAQLQRRDNQLADMEKRMVAMAGQLSDIRDDIQKQAETCGAGGGTTTIIQAPKLPAGSRYNKKDVEPVLKQARSVMSKKNIAPADLPGGIASLEKEATTAMADGEYGKAYLAAQTLLQNVEAIKIDKAFVSAKIARLNRVMKQKKLDDATSKQVLDLFNEVGEKYNDGDFTGANKRLQEIGKLL